MQSVETNVQELESVLTVAAKDEVAEGVVRLTLVSDTGELPFWTPGAHVDLVLGDFVRQYSLCGDPSTSDSFQVAVLREPESRGGSSYVHDTLAQGDKITVRGPRNHFTLVTSPRYIFIAGGIGITPMLPMIVEAEAAGADWHLYYCGRSRRTMAFCDFVSKFGERVTLLPADEGLMLDLPVELAEPQPDTAVYVCGPESLISGVEEVCADTWPAGAVHFERFSAKAVEVPEGGNTEFELVLASSGITTTVKADETVFDAIQNVGVTVLASCHEGICGTCEQAVIEGEVDHRDSILNEQERAANDAMMVCVSRCKSARLVLDM